MYYPCFCSFDKAPWVLWLVCEPCLMFTSTYFIDIDTSVHPSHLTRGNVALHGPSCCSGRLSLLLASGLRHRVGGLGQELIQVTDALMYS